MSKDKGMGMSLRAFVGMFGIPKAEVAALRLKYGDYVSEEDLYKESDARGAGVKIEIIERYTIDEDGNKHTIEVDEPKD